MTAPGPALLGRSVIVPAGAEPPPAWAGAPRVVVDAAVVADPVAVVEELHRAWAARSARVIEMAVDPASFRAPRSYTAPVWELGPGFHDWHDRLHFLVWANSYDATRGGELIWWWARKAARLGATEGGPADIVLADGSPAWVDGGPRAPLTVPVEGAAVVHRESVEVGSLQVQPAPVEPSAELAPDQLDAVAHASGPARVIAPAGSGKTRVLTERYRHLLVDRGYEPATVVALAYNKKAQEEMASRLPGLGARIQTLNAWGYSIVSRAMGRRPQMLEEREVRSIVERLVPSRQRRVNTDPIGPYLEGLSLIRLGLRHPEEVEELIDDVPGLAEAYEPYRAELARRGVIDFDEQILTAVEALLRDGELRRAVQADHRHLLVDELQDLTPAHVLLVRLAAGPAADVFGVGDDDQTIYGHAGADPRFLIDYDTYFPGAAHHALEVNYRCPVAVTTTAATLLAYNRIRVPKDIRPAAGVADHAGAVEVVQHATPEGATSLVRAVAGWVQAGAAPDDVAVLARVQSLLLAPHVALVEAGIPITSILDDSVLNRLGMRAALAYLRIAADPDGISGSDLSEVHRRPSRGLPQWAQKWLDRCRSIDDIRRAAARLDDARVAEKLEDLAMDLDRLAQAARAGGTTRQLLTLVRDDIGLGSAMTLLDSRGAAGGSHLDDLEGLLQLADLQPDPSAFEGWLRRVLHREREEAGVTLSTIHRVKGREWGHVALFGVTDGIVPHRLAPDTEEERRILHVGATRARQELVVLADASRPSPFLSEMRGEAVVPHVAQPEPVTSSSAPVRRQVEAVALTDDARAAQRALKEWRKRRARQDGVPAFVILADKHLDGIAAARPTSLEELRRCPGIGPSRLESYGDEILEVLGSLGSWPTMP